MSVPHISGGVHDPGRVLSLVFRSRVEGVQLRGWTTSPVSLTMYLSPLSYRLSGRFPPFLQGSEVPHEVIG